MSRARSAAQSFNAKHYTDTVAMPDDVAVELLAPTVAHAAERRAIRLLSIKGNFLERQGLRASRMTSDVDLLVEPDRFDQLVDLLRGHGWVDRDGSILVDLPAVGSVLAPHARTLEHMLWPCQLDLHRYFPGFLAPAARVFDMLWEERVAVRVGHVDCAIPSPRDHWILAALNALRSGDAGQLSSLETRARHMFADNLPSLACRALELGAAGPLSEVLSRLTGATLPVPAKEHKLLDEWHRRLGSTDTLPEAIREQLHCARGTKKIKILLRWVAPTERSARAFHGFEGGALRLTLFYVRRLITLTTKLFAYSLKQRAQQSRRVA